MTQEELTDDILIILRQYQSLDFEALRRLLLFERSRYTLAAEQLLLSTLNELTTTGRIYGGTDAGYLVVAASGSGSRTRACTSISTSVVTSGTPEARGESLAALNVLRARPEPNPVVPSQLGRAHCQLDELTVHGSGRARIAIARRLSRVASAVHATVQRRLARAIQMLVVG
jgi:hypothetical protein